MYFITAANIVAQFILCSQLFLRLLACIWDNILSGNALSHNRHPTLSFHQHLLYSRNEVTGEGDGMETGRRSSHQRQQW